MQTQVSERRPVEKIVISAQELLEDSFRLGSKIIQSGFRPTVIIAIWRGGTPVGMAVQEILAFCGIEADHIAIRTSSYTGYDQRKSIVKVHGLNYLIKRLSHDDRLLIVDDVLDTGHTLVAVIDELRRRARGNMPEDVRVAVPWYKPERNQTDLVPDYCIHETPAWLVFPHELDALTAEEMQKHRPVLHELIGKVKKQPAGGQG